MSILEAVSRASSYIERKMDRFKASVDGPALPPRAFCPRCSSRLFYLHVRSVWRCDKGHEFNPTDHSVARFQVPS